MLRARGLTLRYSGAAAPAVDRVSLDLPPGGWIAVAGPSGCGKSSLLRVLAGLRDLATGDVTLDGTRLPSAGDKAARRAWHRRPAPRG